ncbi:bifunctional adenosylcobinamide kinase/adenosylcobinamide-phosphate guanylyltransferase [Alkaliphilus peptidifermentans]|uniref:Bifunctional adenosylcobalamin biosynthesis protein CobU n=1 Tax=Alkaliphilus peptidifermentans DSM 18978 TaxID=1120976 RepID=A0A1G5K3T8_9FIRM|nr:bifunctional adenosylcobinamide kinase/adenosylcobinamide-phosphate guanylyltransferase [Alkaliphilus peptidifermentans]SCY94740.1 adenosylcobinamide kinase /adenosylcobinamide-phosphate guanylyltransferase [Alkaliphilus peptidifermentans DSM 18978]
MKNQSIILITGGARSGKSSFAEETLKDIEGKVLYIATAQAYDDEMKDRIEKHKQRRYPHWITYEGYQKLHGVIEDYQSDVKGILLDCVTLLITNLMLENNTDWDSITPNEINQIEESIMGEMKKLVNIIKEVPLKTVLVTNEVGLGIVPEYKMARVFRDMAGRINQYLAREANEVYFVVSGIPWKLK